MPVLDNPQHEKFAQELFKGTSAQIDAYVAAGFKRSEGACSRLANSPKVKARVEELMAGAAEKAEITQADVLRELARIGFSDIRKLFGPNGHLKRIEDLDDEAAACLSSIEVVTKKVPGGEEAEVEHVAKLKMWDKPSALVNIGKHLGMFKEAPAEAPQVHVHLNDAELARLIVFQLQKAQQG